MFYITSKKLPNQYFNERDKCVSFNSLSYNDQIEPHLGRKSLVLSISFHLSWIVTTTLIYVKIFRALALAC